MITPSNIALEAIECPLCHKQFNHLGNHLRFTHHLSSDDYRKMFPGALLTSNLFRQNITKSLIGS